MHFVFQESQIMTAGNPVDPNGKICSVKNKTEERARRKLPNTSLGRTWVLIEKKD